MAERLSKEVMGWRRPDVSHGKRVEGCPRYLDRHLLSTGCGRAGASEEPPRPVPGGRGGEGREAGARAPPLKP